VNLNLPARSILQEELERSNSFLRNLILSSVDAVIASDRQGKIRIFNDSAAETTGYTVDEALSDLNIREVYPEGVAYDVMDRLRGDEYGGEGKLKEFQVDLKGKNGELIPISLYAPIIYEDDQEVATIGFFHDLRHQLRLNEELERTQMQLLQSEKDGLPR